MRKRERSKRAVLMSNAYVIFVVKQTGERLHTGIMPKTTTAAPKNMKINRKTWKPDRQKFKQVRKVVPVSTVSVTLSASVSSTGIDAKRGAEDKRAAWQTICRHLILTCMYTLIFLCVCTHSHTCVQIFIECDLTEPSDAIS